MSVLSLEFKKLNPKIYIIFVIPLSMATTFIVINPKLRRYIFFPKQIMPKILPLLLELIHCRFGVHMWVKLKIKNQKALFKVKFVHMFNYLTRKDILVIIAHVITYCLKLLYNGSGLYIKTIF
jgi:hypothetical protein